MEVRQLLVTTNGPDASSLAPLAAINPQLVILFGSVEQLSRPGLISTLKQAFPTAALAGCSTAGEILAGQVENGSLTLTAVHFDRVQVRLADVDLESMESSAACGESLGNRLASDDLRAVLVFGQGVSINGSALAEGLARKVGNQVPISGGLAGDNGAFQQTLTLSTDRVSPRQIVAVGLYGKGLVCTHGSFGGWQAFGPLRKVTRSVGNVLYALDGEPALEVYKRYLGDYAKGLPASGLLFPFEMVQTETQAGGLIRTILGVDETEGSLTLAGNIDPEGYLRLMHSSTNQLVDGAETAARHSAPTLAQAELALLVSCVGRKLVMGDRVDEEVEAVAQVLGQNCKLTGFYSYGEISPGLPVAKNSESSCQLHNQTMTITCLAESTA